MERKQKISESIQIEHKDKLSLSPLEIALLTKFKAYVTFFHKTFASSMCIE